MSGKLELSTHLQASDGRSSSCHTHNTLTKLQEESIGNYQSYMHPRYDSME